MYKILLVEDDDSQIQSCEDTVARLNEENGSEYISLYKVKSYDEYTCFMNKNTDCSGVIVDIRLLGDINGNDVVINIIKKHRIPITVYTGNPSDFDVHLVSIPVYTRGEIKYEEIIKEQIRLYDAGVFKILGGEGEIENAIQHIFWHIIYPRRKLWINLKNEDKETEKIILRYTVAHIHDLVDCALSKHIIDEMYIIPSDSSKVFTGTILKTKDNNFYIVVSPPCDLVERDGKIKTDRIAICEIEKMQIYHDVLLKDIQKEKVKIKKIENIIKNNEYSYLHWLPMYEDVFPGGYINFRSIFNKSKEDIDKNFEKINLKIQNHFVKDILGRLSAYYGRQGQPDFDFEIEAKNLLCIKT